jgi:membrane complex biogenesis BtpA family protein
MIDFKHNKKTIIAMLHVAALPGTPKSALPLSRIIDKVCDEAKVYLEAGVHALMIENMYDVPYLKNSVGPEITASMSAIAVELRKLTDKPIGIQILAGANKEALAVANAANLDFIRAEGFVFGHLADEGFFESCAGELLRYRKQIGAENVAIYTDVKKKHSSHAITADISLAETVKAAEFFLSDGILVTGTATGEEVKIADLTEARKATSLPLLIGSGITAENLPTYWNLADGFIVGSYFKEHGSWKNDVDCNRLNHFMQKVKELV